MPTTVAKGPNAEVLERLTAIQREMIPRKEFDDLKARLGEDDLDKRIEDVAKRQINDAVSLVRDRSLAVPPGMEDDAEIRREFRVLNIIRALHPDYRGQPWDVAPLEWHVSQQIRKYNEEKIARRNDLWREAQELKLERIARKDIKEKYRASMVAGTDSLGGFLVMPQLMSNEWRDIFRANSALDQLGISELNGLSAEPVIIPKATQGLTGYWLAETGAPTESNMKFGQMTLRPRRFGALASISDRLLKESDQSVENMVRNSLLADIALFEQNGLLEGISGESQPAGLFLTEISGGSMYQGSTWAHGLTDVNLGTNGGAMTLAKGLDFEGALQDADALMGNLGFLTHPKVLRKWQQDTAVQYVTPVPMSVAKLQELVGYKIATTTQVKTTLTKGSASGVCAQVAFGNWKDYFRARFQGIELRRSTEAHNAATGQNAFLNGLVFILAIGEVDGGVIRGASIAASNEALYQ